MIEGSERKWENEKFGNGEKEVIWFGKSNGISYEFEG